ncbi:MAG TPA: TorF family putative porin [Rubrivivax sp.]|nr:TorF family putative porin [Rubrivivax sp.]
MPRSLLTIFRAAPLLVAVAATALPATAFADLAFNAGAVSDYRYRGISQTRLKPALQGGIDFSSGGFYAGTWASTIKWIEDWQGDAQVEIDFYAGFKGDIVKDTATFDVGVLQYVYPGARTAAWDAGFKNPNTTEVYGAVSFGPVTGKLSYALSNLFGNYDFANGRDSKGSWYADLSASFDVGGGVTLTPHIGRQKVKDIPNASYTDWSLALSKDFSGLVPSIAIVGTDADKVFYAPGPAANSSKFLGKSAVVVGLKYNF